ncbi:uncharacterized protein JCM10292_003844 [Rhodotorula paludigena]|uniref:uncharacterized protein n=1 Tax=Rhodotorula paludigena TaxID=86838 RepID=UPI00317A8E63
MLIPLSYLLALPTLALSAPLSAPPSISSALSAFTPPSSASASWSAGATTAFSAHSSCNATQRRLIADGLGEALELAQHARAHLRRWGADGMFKDWFGAAADPNGLEGLLDRLVDGDRAGLLFRCDDPDAECDGEYGVIPGYFRAGEKDQTVVCETYYLAKPSLENLCVRGQTLFANGSELTQGAWFLHRLLHLPQASGGRLSDVVDTAEEALELAKGPNAHVYAYDILLPGVGCRGDNSTSAASE